MRLENRRIKQKGREEGGIERKKGIKAILCETISSNKKKTEKLNLYILNLKREEDLYPFQFHE